MPSPSSPTLPTPPTPLSPLTLQTTVPLRYYGGDGFDTSWRRCRAIVAVLPRAGRCGAARHRRQRCTCATQSSTRAHMNVRSGGRGAAGCRACGGKPETPAKGHYRKSVLEDATEASCVPPARAAMTGQVGASRQAASGGPRESRRRHHDSTISRAAQQGGSSAFAAARYKYGLAMCTCSAVVGKLSTATHIAQCR